MSPKCTRHTRSHCRRTVTVCFSNQILTSKSKAGDMWCTTAHQALCNCGITPAGSYALFQKGSKYLAKYICLVHLTLLDLLNSFLERKSARLVSTRPHLGTHTIIGTETFSHKTILQNTARMQTKTM